MKKKISITIDSHLLREIDSSVDNIYIRNRSQAIEFLAKNALGERKTAVILAGGPEESLKIGKDFRPTARIGKKTVIELAVEKLRASGFRNIFIIARQHALTAMFNILKDGSGYGVKVDYIEEKESSGTADSLRLARGKIEKTFLVVYSDIVFSRANIDEIWNSHIKGSSISTLMLTSSNEPSEKGAVTMEGSRIIEFSQKPAETETNLVFSPIFACEPELLECRGASLEKDIFPRLAEKGLLSGYISAQKERHIHSEEDLKSSN